VRLGGGEGARVWEKILRDGGGGGGLGGGGGGEGGGGGLGGGLGGGGGEGGGGGGGGGLGGGGGDGCGEQRKHPSLSVIEFQLALRSCSGLARAVNDVEVVRVSLKGME
jgi:hypothetical protein